MQPSGRCRLTPVHRAAIERLGRAGKSSYAIATELVLSWHAVNGHLVRLGLRGAPKLRQPIGARRCGPKSKQKPPSPLPVADSGWFRPPTRAELMAGR